MLIDKKKTEFAVEAGFQNWLKISITYIVCRETLYNSLCGWSYFSPGNHWIKCRTE